MGWSLEGHIDVLRVLKVSSGPLMGPMGQTGSTLFVFSVQLGEPKACCISAAGYICFGPFLKHISATLYVFENAFGFPSTRGCSNLGWRP